MRYKLLGRSGLRVSELALGTMTFGDAWGWGADADESKKQFDLFAEAGGNFIDTSVNYTNGQAETILGGLLKAERAHFVLATKYSLTNPESHDPNSGGNSRKNMRQSVERSLQHLQTDYIDLLYLHIWDHMTPLEEVVRGMQDLVEQGKVNYVAFSDTPAYIVSAAVTLAVLPWGVLGQGILLGKYSSGSTETTRWDKSGVKISQQTQATIDCVAAVAAESGMTKTQVCVNWIRQSKRAEFIPVLGARTAVQLQESLDCLKYTLSDEHMQRLDAVSRIEYGFPRDFLEGDMRQRIFGSTFDQIDHPLDYPVW